MSLAIFATPVLLRSDACCGAFEDHDQFGFALTALLGVRMAEVLDRALPLEQVASGRDVEQLVAVGLSCGCETFLAVEDCVSALWSPAAEHLPPPTFRNWVRSVNTRAVVSRTGSGARQAQRRVKESTGQSQRALDRFARAEEAMERILGSPPEEPVDLADLAVAAGYADQSHMGRNVRTLTGLSPGQLRLRIADDEAFWYYRLVGSAVPKRLQ